MFSFYKFDHFYFQFTKKKNNDDNSKVVSQDDVEKAIKNLQGWAKSTLNQITNFINNDKYDLLNKN